ncbi:alpha-(1,3)-fucosyltransferase C-like [Trichoplusia ni]|uniref:Fucosyltransferase n=1 Tax=Trichoplusia ni TaxID=7111 RepID=A0A7E5W8M0_TRINI|nr:alpha-(1,3)-fucosyltransferase C-like [Trichoplusia ni]
MRQRMHSLLFIEMKPTFLPIVPATRRETTSQKMYLVSRTETFAKLFFIVSFTGLFMYVALAFYSFHTAYTTVSQVGKDQDSSSEHDDSDRFDKDLKYILLWTDKSLKEHVNLEGQSPFIENGCSEINCYITTNRTILNQDVRNFDAVIFNISLLLNWSRWPIHLPKGRSQRQKYVFYGMEASDDHPICNLLVDNFFNWTWSYKFHSDIFTPFIEVKDMKGKVVAPNSNVLWSNSLTRTTNSVINVTKTRAVAWIMDKCEILSNKMLSILKLKQALKDHNLYLDIYGCGHFQCPQEDCKKMLQRDYYFYLAIEGAISEDFVSTEVLKAYDNDVVPIVVGGADYIKFLPDNSYINFQYYTEEKLAAYLDYTIRNPSLYKEYFTWKKFYTIRKANTFNGYCQLCKLLNDKKKFNSFSSYADFRKWWFTGSLKNKCIPKGAERYTDLLGYLNDSSRIG